MLKDMVTHRMKLLRNVEILFEMKREILKLIEKPCHCS